MLNQYNEILTSEEVMDILYIGKNTLYKLLKDGEIKAFRIGRKWRIPRDSLAGFIVSKYKK